MGMLATVVHVDILEQLGSQFVFGKHALDDMEEQRVHARLDDEPDTDDIVVVSVPGSGTVCRKLVRTGDGIILQPFNRHYSSSLYREEETGLLPVLMRGKVITVIRNVRSSSHSVPEL